MIKVEYELCQYECCGKEFKVGDNISWLVIDKNNIKLSEYNSDIDYYVEYHSSDYQNISVITGKIIKIEGVYKKYEKLDENSKVLSTVDCKLEETNSSEDTYISLGEYDLCSFIITLKNYKIRPSKYEEVTFR